MTTATIESISPDAWLAQGFYQRAHEFLRDGQSTGLSAAGRQVLLHSAALAACDAVLAINGRQVLGSEGGQVPEAIPQETFRAREHLEPRMPDHMSL